MATLADTEAPCTEPVVLTDDESFEVEGTSAAKNSKRSPTPERVASVDAPIDGASTLRPICLSESAQRDESPRQLGVSSAVPSGVFLNQWKAVMSHYYRKDLSRGTSTLLAPVPMAELRQSVSLLSSSRFSRGAMNDAPEFFEFFLSLLINAGYGVASATHVLSSIASPSAGLWPSPSDVAVSSECAPPKKQTKRPRGSLLDAASLPNSLLYEMEDSWECNFDKCAAIGRSQSVTRFDGLFRVKVFSLERLPVDPFAYNSFGSFVRRVSGGDGELTERRACPTCGEGVTVRTRMLRPPSGYATVQLSWHKVPDSHLLRYLLLDVIEDYFRFEDFFAAVMGLPEKTPYGSLNNLLPRVGRMRVGADMSSDDDCQSVGSAEECRDVTSFVTRGRRLQSPAARPRAKLRARAGRPPKAKGGSVLSASGSLSAMVCFRDRHYVAIVRGVCGEWFVCEDGKQPVSLGQAWSDVIAWMLFSRMAPLLLSYEVSPTDRDPTGGDLVPAKRPSGAVIEKLLRSLASAAMNAAKRQAQSIGALTLASPTGIHASPVGGSQQSLSQSLLSFRRPCVATVATTPASLATQSDDGPVGRICAALGWELTTDVFSLVSRTLKECGNDANTCHALLLKSGCATTAPTNRQAVSSVPPPPAHPQYSSRQSFSAHVAAPAPRPSNVYGAATTISSFLSKLPSPKSLLFTPNSQLPQSVIGSGSPDEGLVGAPKSGAAQRGSGVAGHATRAIGLSNAPATLLGKQFYVSLPRQEKQNVSESIVKHGGSVISKTSPSTHFETVVLVMRVEDAVRLLSHELGDSRSAGAEVAGFGLTLRKSLQRPDSCLKALLRILPPASIRSAESFVQFVDRGGSSFSSVATLPPALCSALKAFSRDNLEEAFRHFQEYNAGRTAANAPKRTDAAPRTDASASSPNGARSFGASVSTGVSVARPPSSSEVKPSATARAVLVDGEGGVAPAVVAREPSPHGVEVLSPNRGGVRSTVFKIFTAVANVAQGSVSKK